MKRTALLTGAVLLFATLAVQAGAGNAVKASSSRALVKTAYNKKIGKKILVDGGGRTLYMFTTDTHGKDTVCTPTGPYGAECPQIWPALTSAGHPHAGKGVKASLLTVYKRSDGKHQVRYNRHPLYYFHGDPSTPPETRNPGT